MRYRCKGKYEETLMSELKMGDVMKKLLYLEEHISCKDYSPDILVGFKHRIVREESELKEQDKILVYVDSIIHAKQLDFYAINGK